MKHIGLSKKLLLLLTTLFFSVSTGFAAGSAFHYQLDLTARLITNAEGEFTAVEMSWLYDPELSATLMDGEDLSESKREETLKKRASDILDGLKSVNYFTTIKVDNNDLKLKTVEQYNLQFTEQSRLQLNMTLPLETAAALKGHRLELVVSDSSAVGLATFVDPTHLILSEPLKEACQSPDLKQSELGVIDEHKIMSETMTVDCR